MGKEFTRFWVGVINPFTMVLLLALLPLCHFSAKEAWPFGNIPGSFLLLPQCLLACPRVAFFVILEKEQTLKEAQKSMNIFRYLEVDRTLYKIIIVLFFLLLRIVHIYTIFNKLKSCNI